MYAVPLGGITRWLSPSPAAESVRAVGVVWCQVEQEVVRGEQQAALYGVRVWRRDCEALQVSLAD